MIFTSSLNSLDAVLCPNLFYSNVPHSLVLIYSNALHSMEFHSQKHPLTIRVVQRHSNLYLSVSTFKGRTGSKRSRLLSPAPWVSCSHSSSQVSGLLNSRLVLARHRWFASCLLPALCSSFYELIWPRWLRPFLFPSTCPLSPSPNHKIPLEWM